MTERIRVRCPVCGQMTDTDRMEEVEEQPAEVGVYLQEFGGKQPSKPDYGPDYKKGRRGSAKGFITYKDLSADATAVEPFRQWFLKRVQRFLTGS